MHLVASVCLSIRLSVCLCSHSWVQQRVKKSHYQSVEFVCVSNSHVDAVDRLLISHAVCGTWLLCICKPDLICLPRTFSTWGTLYPLSAYVDYPTDAVDQLWISYMYMVPKLVYEITHSMVKLQKLFQDVTSTKKTINFFLFCYFTFSSKNKWMAYGVMLKIMKHAKNRPLWVIYVLVLLLGEIEEYWRLYFWPLCHTFASLFLTWLFFTFQRVLPKSCLTRNDLVFFSILYLIVFNDALWNRCGSLFKMKTPEHWRHSRLVLSLSVFPTKHRLTLK